MLVFRGLCKYLKAKVLAVVEYDPDLAMDIMFAMFVAFLVVIVGVLVWSFAC